jgi:DNA repair protein RAD50
LPSDLGSRFRKRRYTDNQVEDKLLQIDNRIKKLDNDMAAIVTELQDITEETNRHEIRASEQAVERRNIEDNLRLRHLRVNLEATIRELGNMTRERAEMNKESLLRQFERLKNKHDKLVQERARIMGELVQLEAQDRQLTSQLNTDYKNIEKQFADALINLKTKEMAHIDLEKYGKALDT